MYVILDFMKMCCKNMNTQYRSAYGNTYHAGMSERKMDNILPWFIRMRLQSVNHLLSKIQTDPTLLCQTICDAISKDLLTCKRNIYEFFQVQHAFNMYNKYYGYNSSSSSSSRHAENFCRAIHVFLITAIIYFDNLDIMSTKWCLTEIENLIGNASGVYMGV